MYSCSCMVVQRSSFVCHHYLLEGRYLPVESTEVKANLISHLSLSSTLHQNSLNDLENNITETYFLQHWKIRQLQSLVVHECELAHVNANQV